MEVPQSVLPDTVFKAVVKVPYDLTAQQVGADGSKVGLNVGAVLMLPEGFKIAPDDRISEELKAETKDLFYQSYSDTKENIIIVEMYQGKNIKKWYSPSFHPTLQLTRIFTLVNTQCMQVVTEDADKSLLKV